MMPDRSDHDGIENACKPPYRAFFPLMTTAVENALNSILAITYKSIS
jgi:hypothetical protein